MSLMVVQDSIIKDIADAIRDVLVLPSHGIIGYESGPEEIITKYSATPNIDKETGESSGSYGNNLNLSEDIEIPGATGLDIAITYQTEGTSYDYVTITDSTGKDITGKLGGTSKTTKTYTVTGEKVTFTFHSDASNSSYYGYYAIIKSQNKLPVQIPIYGPINQMYPYEIPKRIKELSSNYNIIKYASSPSKYSIPLPNGVQVEDVVAVICSGNSSEPTILVRPPLYVTLGLLPNNDFAGLIMGAYSQSYSREADSVLPLPDGTYLYLSSTSNPGTSAVLYRGRIQESNGYLTFDCHTIGSDVMAQTGIGIVRDTNSNYPVWLFYKNKGVE